MASRQRGRQADGQARGQITLMYGMLATHNLEMGHYRTFSTVVDLLKEV
jgi:hypothetical protein